MFLADYLSFPDQPMRNKMPIKRVTVPPMISMGLIAPPDDITNATTVSTAQAMPTVMKTTAPITLYFHDMSSISNKTSDGILCINNPIANSPAFEASSKTSREKMARKSANKIISILGVQNTNLLIPFFILQ